MAEAVTGTAAAGATAPAAVGAAAPAAGGGAGNGAAAFLAQIPADIRGEAYFKDIKDVPGLATRAYHQAKLIGLSPDQIVRLPGPDDAAGWGTVYNRLGRPEAADKYQLADPAQIPEGLAINAEAKGKFATKAHELGLSQKQADGLYQFFNSGLIARFTALTAAEAEGLGNAEKTLKTEWGAAYNQKLQASELAVQTFAETLQLGDSLDTAIRSMPAASRVALGKVFAHLGDQMREDGIIGRGGAGNAGTPTPVEARQQINALLTDPQFTKAYLDARAVGHADAVQKMARLHEFATASAAA